MLGYDAIIILLLVGVLAVLVPFMGGLRGLFTPEVTPFFLKKKTEEDADELSPVSKEKDSSTNPEPRRREAA